MKFVISCESEKFKEFAEIQSQEIADHAGSGCILQKCLEQLRHLPNLAEINWGSRARSRDRLLSCSARRLRQLRVPLPEPRSVLAGHRLRGVPGGHRGLPAPQSLREEPGARLQIASYPSREHPSMTRKKTNLSEWKRIRTVFVSVSEALLNSSFARENMFLHQNSYIESAI